MGRTWADVPPPTAQQPFGRPQLHRAGLHPLDLGDSRQLARLLCDDSARDGGSHPLSRPDFAPDGFTVAERIAGSVPLDAGEEDFEAWMARSVAGKVRGALPGTDPAATAAIAEFCAGEALRLLEHRYGGERVADGLWNQELTSVVDRVIAHCALGDARAPLATHAGYAALGRRVSLALAPRVVEHCRGDVARLLRFSLAAGLLGAERKLRVPRPGLALDLRPDEDPEAAAARLWSAFAERAERVPVVDDTPSFLGEVLDRPTRLVWFFDDCPETAFDLLALSRLAELNPRLRITMVPKSLPCYTDADTGYVRRLLASPAMHRLGVTANLAPATLCRSGPAMATANLRKLSPDLAARLAAADCVFVKGTSIHEMFQGGLSRPMYTGFTLVSGFNESAMGIDAAEAPLMLLRTGAGQYASWGFEGRARRRASFAGPRTVRLCWDTLADRLRRGGADRETLRAELLRLDRIAPQVAPRTRHALDAERALVRRALTGYRSPAGNGAHRS
ncbi:ARMT1-like domain-containing protein [Kitasatospora sp. NPDC050543]|uniref:ARMT1-like domain-containing protein n=1 Tax=Kitasatospora sp. NPDC050543 TaxID=3364054 RepID=UPI0037B65E41